MLVEFPSVVDAVHCAVEVEQAMPDRNIGVATFRLNSLCSDPAYLGGIAFGQKRPSLTLERAKKAEPMPADRDQDVASNSPFSTVYPAHLDTSCISPLELGEQETHDVVGKRPRRSPAIGLK
jgi:hypothetical protein